MIPTVRALFEHMAWADSVLLNAVREHGSAYQDEDVRKLLHHIAVVQRFFLSKFVGTSFDAVPEMQIPSSIDALENLLHEAHQGLMSFAETLDDDALARHLKIPELRDFSPTVRDVLIQVAMHSEHHRAQLATKLRQLGGKPPVTDYIIWVKERTTMASHA